MSAKVRINLFIDSPKKTLTTNDTKNHKDVSLGSSQEPSCSLCVHLWDKGFFTSAAVAACPERRNRQNRLRPGRRWRLPVLECWQWSSTQRAFVRDRRLERNCCNWPMRDAWRAEVVADPIICADLHGRRPDHPTMVSVCAGMVASPPWSFIFHAV